MNLIGALDIRNIEPAVFCGGDESGRCNHILVSDIDLLCHDVIGQQRNRIVGKSCGDILVAGYDFKNPGFLAVGNQDRAHLPIIRIIGFRAAVPVPVNTVCQKADGVPRRNC